MGLFGKKASSAVDWLVVGLGNPGDKYARTRHNAGWMAVDHCAEAWGCDVKKLKFKGLTGIASVGQAKVLLLKPTCFMNNSGEAVREAADFYKIPANRVIVLYDEVALEPGALRIREKGSAGGHNGIKSVLAHLGSEEFVRFRFGVGGKPDPRADLADWVLSAFGKEDQKSLTEAFDKARAGLELWVNGQRERAMNLYSK
ncbi:MAG: aminoacyl-tRNA hydrolase [Clostridia bacterium]|nr:aminoacyl-tRNA hydrolase [Clostridia bacterium]